MPTDIPNNGEADLPSPAGEQTEEPTAIALDIPLEFDENAASQLGSTTYKNKTEANLTSPRAIITEKEIRNFRFQARYRGPTRFGTYEGQPACLIIVDFAFQKFGSTISRLTHAEVNVTFEDGKFALVDDLDAEQEAESVQYQPRILAFEPHEYHGPTSSGSGSTTVGLQTPIALPGGVVSITPGISRTTPFTRDRYEKIHGLLTDDDSRIYFSVYENSMNNSGIRSEWSAAIIVGYTPKRRFAARVTIKAHIFLRIVNPVCGKKDDPVFFDDEVMKKAAPVSVVKQQGATCKVMQGLQGEVLDGVDLKAQTRLKTWGGAFLDHK